MEQSDKALVCPVCGLKNQPDTERCIRCGVILLADATTAQVPSEIADQIKAGRSGVTQPLSVHRHGLLNDGVVLYIAGEVRPLVIRGQKEFLLGRRTEGPLAEDMIDLTPYHGHLLGVSRRHARLKIDGEDTFVEDLDSTNGTWLNERRLAANTPYVIRNGDQLRLGQLIMFIYFASASTKQQITLKATDTAVAFITPQRITAPYLASNVSPYLDAIIGLQAAVDTLLGRAPGPHGINAINVNAENYSVEVDLEGVTDAVQVIQDILMPWRRRNRTVVAQLRVLAASGEPADAELDQALRVAQDNLSREILREILGGAPEGDTPHTVERLEAALPEIEQEQRFIAQVAPHLRILAASTLEIVRSTA